MQFIKQKDDSSLAFSVWLIEKTSGNLLPDNMKNGHILKLPSIRMVFQLLPIFFSGIKLFEFKFYR